MPDQHSKWSASGFEQRMLCPGSHVLQAGKPRSSSKYAAEGTAAHQVLTWALQENKPASAYIDRTIEADGFVFVVDDDMAGHVQTCIDYVMDAKGEDGEILVDQRVNYSAYLDVPESDAWGTLDVAILRGDEIHVIDFKYGRGVEVSAGALDGDFEIGGYDGLAIGKTGVVTAPKPNPQMALYALGALVAYNGLLGEFTRVRLAISQPRLSAKPSEYDLSVEALEAWGRSTARSAVATCRNAQNDRGNPAAAVMDREWEETYLTPGEKQCKFCSAKATCPKLLSDVTSTICGSPVASPDEFEVPGKAHLAVTTDEWLSACMTKADMIDDWLKAVRAEVEARLLAGKPVPGFKLVEGKQGNRAWTDKTAAEKLLREQFRLPIDVAYDLSLISPTTAEKLTKGDKPVIGSRQWGKAQALIGRAPAKPHVAPLSDKRPALEVKPVADEFQPVSADPELSDLA